MKDAIEQVVDQFYTFLHKQSSKEKWETNVRNNHKDPDEIFIGMSSERPRDYIAGAFEWDKTPEGIRYWGYLDKLWLAELNK